MKETTDLSCETCHPGNGRSRTKGISLNYREFLLSGSVGLLIVLGATGLVREVFGLELVLLAALVGGNPHRFWGCKRAAAQEYERRRVDQHRPHRLAPR